MSRTVRKCWVVPLFGLSCVMAFSPCAAAEGGPIVKTKPQATGGLKLPVHIWKRMRTMHRLERSLLAGVKLDTTQRNAVKKIFADLYRSVNEKPSRGGFYPRAYSEFDANTLKSRKADLKAAQRKGDEKLVKEIGLDIERHTAGTEANLTLIPEDILPLLAALMKSDQIADYQRIVDRWTVLKSRGPFDGPFRMLTRAVQDPALKLTADQLQQAKQVIGDTFVSVRKNRDPDNVAKLATVAREKIMKGFNSEQQAHLDKTLHAFAVETKAVLAYANRWYGGRGVAVPAHFKQPLPWGD